MVVPAQFTGLSLSILGVRQNVETGAFRFLFDVAGAEVSADLTVCWIEDKGLASLSAVEVDDVDASGATAQAIEAWVEVNQDAVFAAALRCL